MINLLFVVPPKLKKKIEDQTAMAEETIRIKLELEGTPEPVVKFYKDGQVLLININGFLNYNE